MCDLEEGFNVFVHGIPFRFVARHYPVISAKHAFIDRTQEQRKDAQRFIDRFGFEPVHFLRSSRHYPLSTCMKECFRFGDTLLIFNTLPYPRLQLSPNEWGVREVDMRRASFVWSRCPQSQEWFHQYLPGVPFFLYAERQA